MLRFIHLKHSAFFAVRPDYAVSVHAAYCPACQYKQNIFHLVISVKRYVLRNYKVDQSYRFLSSYIFFNINHHFIPYICVIVSRTIISLLKYDIKLISFCQHIFLSSIFIYFLIYNLIRNK